MNTPLARKEIICEGEKRPFLSFIPLFHTLTTNYSRSDFTGDLIAGVIVTIMLIPQGMAYALLAGLPPQVGLYASLLPLILYGIFGTSRYLAVGPVAIVSLLTASAISSLGNGTNGIQLALTLALLVGIIQMGMYFLKIGIFVNFLSHPVLVGFTAAAGIVIGFSQMKNLLGFPIPRTDHFYEQLIYLFTHLKETNGTVLLIGFVSIFILWFFSKRFVSLLLRYNFPKKWVIPISKSGPLVVVFTSTLIVWGIGLSETANVAVVGDIPAGLPGFTQPFFDFANWQRLFITALTISFVGYMESISIAKSLAALHHEKVDTNKELFALGLANIGSAFTGGYPVTGGFSRSLVNYAAGARSGLASIITAVLIGLSIFFIAPLFYYIPKAVLAAIILVAVSKLIDFATFKQIWNYRKADGIALLVTFFAVLAIGIELGILLGAIVSLLLFIWENTQLNINVSVEKDNPGTTVYIDIDRPLFFGNAEQLEQAVDNLIETEPEIKELVIRRAHKGKTDFTVFELFEKLEQQLEYQGISLHIEE